LRAVVIGPGGIGGAVTGALWAGRSDLDLTICGRRTFERLSVTGPGIAVDAPVRVLTDPSELAPDLGERPVDLVLLATKAYQTAGTQPWLEQICRPETMVAVLQNGVDHRERVQPLVGASAVLPVVVNLAAERTKPGIIVQRSAGLLTVPDDEHGRRFADWYSDAPIRIRVTEDFLTAAWTKLAGNALFGSVGALTLRKNGVVAEPDLREYARQLIGEIITVGRAEGADLPDDLADQVVTRSLELAGGHTSSIAQDRRDDQPLEWEVRNAVIGRKGRQHAIPTPLNDSITALLRIADAGFVAADDRYASDRV